MTFPDPMRALLTNEKSVSALLALLATDDPTPLPALLGQPQPLDDSALQLVREYPVSAADKDGFLDLAALAGDVTVGLAEVKVARLEHDDQYDTYQRYASQNGLPPSACWVIDLLPDMPGAPEGWNTTTIAEWARHWENSDKPHVAMLARRIAAAAQAIVDEMTTKLGEVTFERKLVDATVAKNALAYLDRASTGELTFGAHTSMAGGGATAYAFVPIPGWSDDVAMMRADLRKVPDQPTRWHLRMGVELDPKEDDATPAERQLACKLAAPVLPTLTHTSFTSWLHDKGAGELADALVTDVRGWRDGMKTCATPQNLDTWQTMTGNASATVPYLERGTFPSTQLLVDADELTGMDVARLLFEALEYLRHVARDVPDPATVTGTTA